MLDCLILGDSIAVGTQQFKPECAQYARVGITSSDWNRRYLSNDLTAKTVVISLGSNDWGNRTKAELQRIREKVGINSKVYWILPSIKPEVQQHIRATAAEYGDQVLGFTPSTDRVHPTASGYRELAKAIP
jgi:lysophospholipase L1-like esterase